MFDHSNATLCSHRSDLSLGVSIKVNQSLSIIKQSSDLSRNSLGVSINSVCVEN